MTRRHTVSNRTASFTGSLREGRHASVVQPASAIEDRTFDARLLGAAREQRPHRLGAVRLSAPGLRVGIQVRRGRDRPRVPVVDELRVDVPVRAVHGETRPLRAPGDALAHPPVAAEPRDALRPRVHQALVFAALPAFFRTCSPSYRIPLPLYGSGGRIFRIFAALSPTARLSFPRTVM